MFILPNGTQIPIDLPEFSILDDTHDQGMAQCVALNTPYLPVLRDVILTGINVRLESWPKNP